MGCSSSKLDEEEAVRLCKDRKKFIRQAVEHRLKFAAGHVAYLQAMKRVSAALREYIDEDEPREFLLDSFTTPIKRTTTPGFISIKPDSFSVTNSSYQVNFYKPSGTPSISVEERVAPSPETYRVEAYSPIHRFGMESVYATPSSTPMGGSSFYQYSQSDVPSYPSPSPQTSQWDFFWNPFSSLDYYGYNARSSLDPSMLDDENDGLKQVRQEEGIPELEEETEYEDVDDRMSKRVESNDFNANRDREEIVVEDVNDSDDCDCDSEVSGEIEREIKIHNVPSSQNVEIAKSQCVRPMSKKEASVGESKSKDEKPGFTVYVNRRPTSMAEVIKDLEEQFMAACKAAAEMSSILEARRAMYSPSPSDLSARKMLNPVALFKSGSGRSSSSRYMLNALTSKDFGYESSSDFSEQDSLSGSHQSSLDRLYAWEKKLYQEVRAGERIRLAYEKKCAQLRNQDVKGDDPSFVDKTRASIRDLQTQINVSIHAVEAISKRIEALRDEELEPQLLELVQGLARMWKSMAECHQRQKRTLDEAKILLAGTPSRTTRRKYTVMSPSEPHKLAHSAANLENELRNWRQCFESWIVSQRSYMHALTGWLLRCIRSDSDPSKLPFSPRQYTGAPAIFGVCIQWLRLLDAVREVPVLEGMDFFAAGMGSLYAQQLREDSRRLSSPSGGGGGSSKRFDIVEAGHRFEEEEEVVVTAEKMADVAIRVLCAGMSFAVSALTEFAVSSAKGYDELIREWENEKRSHRNGWS
ncbi:hypothetical protein M569_05540 [Genlisea aurea]|uniref:DUF632 domain-containing protein n=1 Tax=Genlisea aurea TaxID=192259 RepID=S8E0K7_9LAMI|nr:hypothetical protein M569_05540 [Genlisea aurea]